MTKITHHHLRAQFMNDDCGPAILLEQQEDGYTEPNSVLAHPWQLVAVCQQFGLVANNRQAEKTIARLQRQMQVLRDRIDAIGASLHAVAAYGREDLSDELAQARALDDLAQEWCRDFDTAETGQQSVDDVSQMEVSKSAPLVKSGQQELAV